MVSFLDPSQLRKKLAAGFKGKLLTGALTRPTASTVNEYGDEVPGAPLVFSVQGAADQYSAYYRATAGIPQTDSKVIIIAGLTTPQTEPQKDDYIQFPNFPLFQVREVMTDPARAHYDCQSSKVNPDGSTL